ncbi:unnamed protein product [Ambrosiozyma monospora]|uniref:Mediator of RNA polymerase II transcription subunit 12 n=1 Tax=Ambrosiozyma monospora TaxID=43982 RepID=A0A9W6SWD5_AMBMO|nr:unnamed protein product [Ambrosiozyma monospora]
MVHISQPLQRNRMNDQIPMPDGVYPLNGDDTQTTGPTGGSLSANNYHASKELVYPDFRVWKHTPKDDTLMRNHLQKGYYEPPMVSNECHSGRQIIYQLFHKNSSSSTSPDGSGGNMSAQENIENTVKSKLTLLSDVMIKTLTKRQEINRVTSRSTYKPPPRVTLTDHKRELWLNNLADTNVSLKQLSRAIPHGLRNRTLLEQCMKHKVPIQRTLWLIRCVSANEQRQLMRKQSTVGITGNNYNNNSTNKWVMEWTEQLTMFVENVIDSCFKPENKDTWKFKLNYTVELVGNIYSEELMFRETFLSWVVSYFSKIVDKENVTVFDFKTLSIYHVILRLFWFKVISIDYLSKELSESLLLLIAKLQELPKNPKTDNLVKDY